MSQLKFIYIQLCTYLGIVFITAAHTALKSQSGLDLHTKHFQSLCSASSNDKVEFLFIQY